MSKQVNIVIPVHDRWELTEQTIQSLLKNTDQKLFDLYIIDDGSTEENYSKLVKLVGDVTQNKVIDEDSLIHLFRNPVAQSPGVSRNYVTRFIKDTTEPAQYLYHSDNDVYFKKDWLKKLIQVYEIVSRHPHNVKVLGGSCHPFLQNKTTIDLYIDTLGTKVGIKDAVSGYSQLMSWEVWNKYGSFDETMKDAKEKIMGSEDWAFCQKIIKDGYKVGSIEPEVVIPCGKTNTYGKPATGSETFKNYAGVKVL